MCGSKRTNQTTRVPSALQLLRFLEAPPPTYSPAHHFLGVAIILKTSRYTWPHRINPLLKCQHLWINVNWPLSMHIPRTAVNCLYWQPLNFYRTVCWHFYGELYKHFGGIELASLSSRTSLRDYSSDVFCFSRRTHCAVNLVESENRVLPTTFGCEPRGWVAQNILRVPGV